MSIPLISDRDLKADCKSCFGLCCVALPFARTADFAIDKEGGIPCHNLQNDFRCKIHEGLRNKGFRGCTVYECFGAGQRVSKYTYEGKDWRETPELANEMFEVFPIMQQLHEMLVYLNEAILREETKPIHQELSAAFKDMVALTHLRPKSILKLDVSAHRSVVNDLLIKTSELVRANVSDKRNHQARKDFIGARLKGADLRGANLRGALLIAADLRGADLRMTDLIGADFRDAKLNGANLRGSIFLTQAQINSAEGDVHTKIPSHLRTPEHWI